MIDLLRARADFVVLARSSVAYCREHGIDWRTAEAACGGVYLAPIRPDPPWFDFDPTGPLAAVCEAIADDGETVLDLVAWSLVHPARVVTAIGAAVALGEAAAINPATYHASDALRLYRTPLAWLKAGCLGAVMLQPQRAGRWLADAPTSRLAAEDDEHAKEIDAMRQSFVQRQRVVVPA